LLPGLDGAAAQIGLRLDRAAAAAAPLPVRVALLLQSLGETAAAAAARRLRADGESLWLAERLPREHVALQALGADIDDGAEPVALAAKLLAAFERCDALRRPQRFDMLAVASDLLAAPSRRAAQLTPLLQQVLELPSAGIAARVQAQGAQGAAVGEAIAAARRERLVQTLAERHTGPSPL
jgi:tRNA nucleotidyltransferase (CCA-adding enzyme)